MYHEEQGCIFSYKNTIFSYTLGKIIVFFLLPEAFCGLKCWKCDSGRGSRRSPDLLVGWGADIPPHTPFHSAPLAPGCSRLRRLDRRAPLTPNPGDATGHHHFLRESCQCRQSVDIINHTFSRNVVICLRAQCQGWNSLQRSDNGVLTLVGRRGTWLRAGARRELASISSRACERSVSGVISAHRSYSYFCNLHSPLCFPLHSVTPRGGHESQCSGAQQNHYRSNSALIFWTSWRSVQTVNCPGASLSRCVIVPFILGVIRTLFFEP